MKIEMNPVYILPGFILEQLTFLSILCQIPRGDMIHVLQGHTFDLTEQKVDISHVMHIFL